MKLYEKIEGYADLSVEEKLAKLESFEEANSEDYEKQINDLKAESIKWKEASNKASSDASKYKKELQAKMTDEERAKSEMDEYKTQMEEKVARYERSEKMANLKSQYLGIGYTEELAIKKAEALIDNDLVKANEVEKEFVEYLKKEADKKSMVNQPTVTVGEHLTKEDIEAQEFNQLKKWAGL